MIDTALVAPRVLPRWMADLAAALRVSGVEVELEESAGRAMTPKRTVSTAFWGRAIDLDPFQAVDQDPRPVLAVEPPRLRIELGTLRGEAGPAAHRLRVRVGGQVVGDESAPWLRDELKAGATTFEVEVEELREDAGWRAVRRSVCAMDRLSLYRSQVRAADRIVDLVPDVVTAALNGLVVERALAASPPQRSDSRSRLLTVTAALGTRFMKRDQWSIRWRARHDERDLDPWISLRDVKRWRSLSPPADRLYADPMLVSHCDQDWLFVEELVYRQGKGRISCTRLGPDGPEEVEPVLASEHHLSYPFLFVYDGEVFMVPECAASDQVTLYQADSFPYEWQPVAQLLDMPGIDPTMLEFDGKWWLWVGVPDRRRVYADLTRLFVADSPFGPWQEHPQSPVSYDVGSARSAGPMIRIGDRLVRPTQDCSRRYGGGLNFMAVDLSPEHYSEQALAPGMSPPAALADGWHTYGRSDAWEVVDTVRERWKRPSLARPRP